MVPKVVVSMSFSLFQDQDLDLVLIVTIRDISALGKLMGILQAWFLVILVTIYEIFTEYWLSYLFHCF